MFDRAAILREAHAATRLRFVPSHSQRYGDRYDRELSAWVPKAGYRAIFAGRLRNAWHMARARRRQRRARGFAAAGVRRHPRTG